MVDAQMTEVLEVADGEASGEQSPLQIAEENQLQVAEQHREDEKWGTVEWTKIVRSIWVTWSGASWKASIWAMRSFAK